MTFDELPQVLKDSLIVMGAKRTMVFEVKEGIRSLVLGSSHGDFGFNPEVFPGSFNLCCGSQDIKHSFLLYQKLHPIMPFLKDVCLFYSVFSPGSILEKSPSQRDISLALNELFGLGLEYSDEYLNSLSQNLSGKLKDFQVNIDGCNGFFPNYGKQFFREDYGVAKRASDHARFHFGSEGNYWLLRMILLARHLGHRMCLVIPPARSDYVFEITRQIKKPFFNLKEILEKSFVCENIRCFNFFGHVGFDDSDFGDFDHLNPRQPGVNRLTETIAAGLA